MCIRDRFTLEPTQIKNVHFIGIGGVSMSGIAELLHDKGFTVTGSDIRDNKYVRHLESVGLSLIHILLGSSAASQQQHAG